MSKKKASDPATEEVPAAEAGDSASQDVPGGQGTEAPLEETPQAGLADPLSELQQQLQVAQAQADENRDRYLRTAAELENVRKRAERDASAARKYGVEKLAADLLGVRDSLELGLAAALEENAEVKAVVEGMELTLKQLSDTLERYGVTQVDPVGETFNPEFHEAMTTQESREQAPNTVMQVLQKGYRLHDRLLRPALVVVAKSPSDAPGGATDEPPADT